MLSRYLLILVMLLPVFGFTQMLFRNNVSMLWLGYYQTIQLSDRLSMVSDAQVRTKEWNRELSQLLLRSGLNLKLKTWLNASIGLADFLFFRNTSVADRNEYRLWQEAAFTYPLFQRCNATSRIRVEQRFFNAITDGRLSAVTQFIPRCRFRQEIQFSFSKADAKRSIKLMLGEEFLFNLSKKITADCFDQNRNWISLNITLSEKFAVQPEFLYIVQQIKNGQEMDYMTVLRCNFYHKLTGRSKHEENRQ